MSTANRLDVVRLSSTIRFVQGYRYLDRCGEAIVRLENTTDEGWIPGEITPSSGHLQNWRLGMGARFDSESMTVHQREHISFEHFKDQTCRIYEILWKTFDIEKILSPTLRVVLQIGFEDLDDANKRALSLGLCKPDNEILDILGGKVSAIEYTVCTETDVVRDGNPVVQRRRLELHVVRQERQPDFDERVLRRLPLLPAAQQNALGHLVRLRRHYPRIAPAAVEFDLENCSEGQLLTRTFDLSGFLEESWGWVSSTQQTLHTLQAHRLKR